MSTGTTTGQGHRVDWMRAHYDELAELFARFGPEDEFRRADLPRFLQHGFDGFKNNSIVEQVRRDGDAKHGTIRWVWSIDRRAYDWIADYTPAALEMPCGHHGIINLGRGEYQCCAKWCDEVHPRKKVEA